MKTNPERQLTPALVSFVSYAKFLDRFRDEGNIPARIDKTLMSKFSGSQIAAMLSTMKYFRQIDDLNKPSEQFQALIKASDDDRKPMLKELLEAHYAFLFNDAHFNLENATSGQVTDKFKELGISGSTVTKAITFFLSAAKECGITVADRIKAPAPPKSINKPRKANKDIAETVSQPDTLPVREAQPQVSANVERFEIPIPGKSSVQVIVPKDFDSEDWEMLQLMLTAYIKRWKSFK